jgi:predicted GNAT family N-acyltransferase
VNWTCRELDYGSQEYRASRALREVVLRQPLGLEWTAQELTQEETSTHVGCFLKDDLVGALVLTPKDAETVRMRLVAVAVAQQGKGAGSALVAFAEACAQQAGYRLLVASARDTAVPFYRACGYEVENNVFVKVGIPHQRVWKKLRPG